MQTFVMLTRLIGEQIHPTNSLKEISKKVEAKIKEKCPEVNWLTNLAVLGPYDYVDIFQAPDTETAFKVATIVRSFGHASTEIWSAMEWGSFKKLI